MRPSLMVFAVMMMGVMAADLRADTWPLADMKKTAKGTTELGEWSLVVFGGRDDFPCLVDRKELEEVEPGRWVLPERTAGELAVSADNVNVRSAGRQNTAADKWMSARVFAPKKGGAYAVSGKMTNLWCDLDQNAKNTLKWAVLRGKADGRKFKVIATGEAGQGDTVDLSAQEAMKKVALEDGETIVITLFRPDFWGAAGGDITAVKIEKAGG